MKYPKFSFTRLMDFAGQEVRHGRGCHCSIVCRVSQGRETGDRDLSGGFFTQVSSFESVMCPRLGSTGAINQSASLKNCMWLGFLTAWPLASMEKVTQDGASGKQCSKGQKSQHVLWGSLASHALSLLVHSVGYQWSPKANRGARGRQWLHFLIDYEYLGHSLEQHMGWEGQLLLSL